MEVRWILFRWKERTDSNVSLCFLVLRRLDNTLRMKSVQLNKIHRSVLTSLSFVE